MQRLIANRAFKNDHDGRMVAEGEEFETTAALAGLYRAANFARLPSAETEARRGPKRTRKDLRASESNPSSTDAGDYARRDMRAE